MRLLDRYILRELWPSFVLAIVVATFVLFVDKLLWLTSLILHNHLDLVTAGLLLCYTLPTVSGLTLPIAFLIGCTLTFNRLSMDSEYVVLKAAGVSVYRMLVPLFAAAVVVYGVASFVLMYVSPWGFQGLQRLFFEVARSRAYYHLRAHEFNDTFKGLVLYVERTVPEWQRLEGIFIADTRSGVSQVITAQAGDLLTQPEAMRVILRLEQGTIHRYAPPYKRYHILQFGHYDVILDLDTQLARQARDEVRPRELFPSQFRAEIERRQALGRNPRDLLLFWHKLFALPFACIIFAGLGPALGVVHPKSGRSAGYVLGLGAIFVYYFFLTASDALAEAVRFLPAFVAAWFPNVCMGSITILLLRRTARDAPQLEVAWLWDGPRRLWQRWRLRSVVQPVPPA
jgi:lipopolysaccharide export system permease protein